MWGFWEWVGIVVAGIIIGLLGKFFAPGNRDDIPLWLTIICGVGGVLLGFWLMPENTGGIDWLRWLVSIVIAAVLVMIAAANTSRRSHA
jgi:uncharacterized membrane protein YeaQ/YmgE (transglycosylase-associated protein family)